MRAFYPWTRAVDTDGKRDEASDSPATVKAETFDESELLDIESLPAICLSPTSNRSMSPLSFFTGGGDSAWCSPSRVLIANDPHDIENNNNDCAAASSIAATPLDFSFDSAHGTELYRSSSGQHTEGRAAYVSATAFNCGRDTRGVGLSISCVQGRLLVSAMGDGVFFNSPIRVGDELVSINGKSCNIIMTGGQATRILNNLDGIVSVVVSTGHDSGLIESMVAKPTHGCKTGLGLQHLQGTLQILHLDPTGLWAHSLLSEGNRVLSINGSPCSQLDGIAAGTLITTSETYVTIVAKSIQETNVVVEEQEQPSSIRPPLFRKPPQAMEIRGKSPPYMFYGPCFQKAWSPAKIAHVAANVIAIVVPAAVCLGLSLGIQPMVVSFAFSFLIVNLPWLGWKDRRGSLCSIGQILSTMLVLFCCAVLLPAYSGSNNKSLPVSLFQNIGIALPLTILANMSMHFTDDDIEYFVVSPPENQPAADESQEGVDIITDEISV